MTRPSYTALRDHNRRVAGMLADPECVGEVLLVGIGMARCVDLDEPPWGEDGSMPMKVIAEQVYGPPVAAHQAARCGEPVDDGGHEPVPADPGCVPGGPAPV